MIEKNEQIAISQNQIKWFDRSLLLPFFLCLSFGITWLFTIKTTNAPIPESLNPYVTAQKNTMEIYSSMELLAEVIRHLENPTPIGKHMYVMHRKYTITKKSILKTYTVGDWCLAVLANMQYDSLPQKPDQKWLLKISSFIVNNSKDFLRIENIPINKKNEFIATFKNLMSEYQPLNNFISR